MLERQLYCHANSELFVIILHPPLVFIHIHELLILSYHPYLMTRYVLNTKVRLSRFRQKGHK